MNIKEWCKETAIIVLFYVFLELPLTVLHRYARIHRWMTKRHGAFRVLLDWPRRVALYWTINRLKLLWAWGKTVDSNNRDLAEHMKERSKR